MGAGLVSALSWQRDGRARTGRPPVPRGWAAAVLVPGQHPARLCPPSAFHRAGFLGLLVPAQAPAWGRLDG